MKVETHSHSYHSFDSLAKIEDIIAECKKKDINALVLNDHDVCNIMDDEQQKFQNNNIELIKAIEFTAFEGVHIIGVDDNIKSLQNEPFFYKANDLVDKLLKISAWIILPHPNHETGIIRNKKISVENSGYCLSKAHFIEMDNYRYGKSKNIEKILSEYKNLKPLVGSDAHRASDIGVFYNEVESYEEDTFKSLYLNSYNCVTTKERGKLYFFKRRIKKTKIYQFFLNKFSAEIRMKIKKKLRLI